MNNKYKGYIISSVVSIVVIMILFKFCANTDGEFDNAIFWNAISSIAGALGFFAVIYSLNYNEKKRNEQNRYELRRAYIMEEQKEFKRIGNDEIEKVNPRKLVNAIKSYEDGGDKRNLADTIYEYQMNCNELPGSLRFYYKYDDEKMKQFEFKFFNYATQSHNIVQKCVDIYEGRKEIDSKLYEEIMDFHGKHYDELRKWIVQLTDDRQKYIEEELRSIEEK